MANAAEFLVALDKKIRRRLQEGAAMRDLVIGDDERKVVQRQFHIKTGLFGFVDLESNSYLTHQTSRYPPRIARDLGFVPEIPREAFRHPKTQEDIGQDLADMLFLAVRPEGSFYSNPPEFYRPHLRADGPPVTEKVSFPDRDRVFRLRDEIPSLVLHADPLEILSLVFLWRCLIRAGMALGFDEPVTELRNWMRVPTKPVQIWRDELFEDGEWAADAPEITFIKGLQRFEREAEQALTPDNKSRVEFLRTTVKEQWIDIESVLDLNAELEPVLSDMVALNLIGLRPEPRGMPLLTRLIKYVALNVRRVEKADQDCVASAYVRLLEEHQEQADRTSWDELQEEGLMEGLAEALASLILGSDFSTASIGQTLAALHYRSPVQLVPYFYQTVLMGGPPEHVVFSIWSSRDHPSEFENDTYHDVSHAIVALRPEWDRKWPTGGKLTQAQLLCRVQQLVAMLGQPVIDQGFYDIIIKPQHERIGRFEQARAFGHEISRLANNLSTNWIRSAADIFEIGRRNTENGDSTGQLLLNAGDFYNVTDIAVASSKQLIDQAMLAFKFWGMTIPPLDLVEYLDNKNDMVTLPDTVEACKRLCHDIAEPHALAGLGRWSDRQKYSRVSKLFRRILKSQLMEIKTAGIMPDVQISDREITPWLIRLLCATILNIIKHSDPFKPITINIVKKDDGMVEFTFSNAYRGEDSGLRERFTRYFDNSIKGGLVSEDDLSQLYKCYGAMHGGIDVLMDVGRTRTPAVLISCIKLLGGRLHCFPEAGNTGEARTAYSIPLGEGR